MRTLYIIAALSMLLAGSTQASDYDWRWRFNTASFGVSPTSADTCDAADQLLATAQSIYAGTYHEQGAGGWDSATGFYLSDIREPLQLVPGGMKMWRFYLWEDPQANMTLELTWGWVAATRPAFERMQYRLTYVRSAEGVTGGNVSVGASVLLNTVQQGTWSFPVYRTTDGRTGYVFELTAEVVPEPSALLALATGLAGVAGLLRARGRR